MNSGKKTLLLVDDDPDQLMVISALFESQDYNVITATSGREGLKLLEKDGVDMVITDISMPQMSGLDFASQIKGNNKTARVPVVLMTAGQQIVDFSSVPFKADLFCLKRNIKSALLPAVRDMLN